METDEPESDELDALGMQQQISLVADENAFGRGGRRGSTPYEGEDEVEIGEDDEGPAFDGLPEEE